MATTNLRDTYETIEMKVSDICDINKSNVNFTKDQLVDYLDTGNLTEGVIDSLAKVRYGDAPSRAQRAVEKDTILYSTVRPNLKHYGIVAEYNPNMVVSTGFTTIDVKENKKEEIDAHFLYYLMTQQWVTKHLHTIAQSSVSSYPSISPSDIGNLEFEFPFIATQRRIASVLSNIDKKIALNRQINANLEALAKQLYDYWFVQFDFPDANGKPYKSSGGKMVYNEKLKREIPDGWHCGNLYEIATFKNGLACQKFRPSHNEHKLPVIKIKEMHDGFTKETEFVKADIPESVKVYNGDVLFSWSASLEVMLWSFGTGGLNQHIFKVTSANGFPKSFYYFQLLNYINVFKKIAEARKTTMGHITTDHLEQSTIAIPDDVKVANRFEQEIGNIFDLIVTNQSEISSLTKQRDELLPLLMNGQVTIE